MEDDVKELKERLARIESLLQTFVSQRAIKDSYSTAEVAVIVGKAEKQVRNWCREGRVAATKRPVGRGTNKEWEVSHEELVRYQAHGLRPASVRRVYQSQP
ncbi:hypothetical protein [Paludisphaera soli]|uniref:hypothetical protein n=1 Tax=Paludisphaera soli TaxID=2712865 RepID=UPI001F0D0D16|nr:hypothetical protein [Paludisphaera soli]